MRRAAVCGRLVGVGDGAADLAAVVAGHVPVLDAAAEAVRELGVVRNVADRVHVLVAPDAEVLVDRDAAVALERDARRLEEVGRGAHARADDYDRRGERTDVLDLDTGDLLAIGRGGERLDLGAAVKRDTLALEVLLSVMHPSLSTHLDEREADVATEDVLERHLVNADNNKAVVLLLSERLRGLDTNEAGADDDDVGVGAKRIVDSLDVGRVADGHHTLEVNAGDGDLARDRAGRKHEVVVLDRRALIRRDGLRLRVDGGHRRTELQLDAKVVGEHLGRAPLDLGRVVDEALGQLGAVDGRVRLGRDDGDVAGVVALLSATSCCYLTSRRLSMVWMAPAPPPTMTTFCFCVAAMGLRARAITRPTLALTSFSDAETKILPSLISTAYFHSESRPGESSMSPVVTLKQAER